MNQSQIENAVQACLVIMKNARFPTAEAAAGAMAPIVGIAEAELLAALRQRLASSGSVIRATDALGRPVSLTEDDFFAARAAQPRS